MPKPVFSPSHRVPGIAATLLGTDATGSEKDDPVFGVQATPHGTQDNPWNARQPMGFGMQTYVEDGLGRGEAMIDVGDGPDSPSDRRLSSHWEKPMVLLVEEGRPLQGIAILHGHAEGEVECLQQGFKLSDAEAKTLVQRLAAGNSTPILCMWMVKNISSRICPSLHCMDARPMWDLGMASSSYVPSSWRLSGRTRRYVLWQMLSRPCASLGMISLLRAFK